MRHRIALSGAALTVLAAVTWGTHAFAQEAPYFAQQMPAPTNAFELQAGSGYAQGFGNLAPNTPIPNVAGVGLGFNGVLAYRVSPAISLGLEGNYSIFQAQNDTAATTLDLNVGTTLHAMPKFRGDPWLRLGTGYRMFWEANPNGSPNTNNMFHGFDIVTAKIGYDFRLAPSVAVAPIFGANLQTFVWENATPLSSAQIGTFLYAGLQARFDAGGTTSSEVTMVGSR